MIKFNDITINSGKKVFFKNNKIGYDQQVRRIYYRNPRMSDWVRVYHYDRTAPMTVSNAVVKGSRGMWNDGNNRITINIKGEVTDFETGVQDLTIDGAVVEIQPNGSFEYNLKIPRVNQYKIPIIARDNVGNTSAKYLICTLTTPSSDTIKTGTDGDEYPNQTCSSWTQCTICNERGSYRHWRDGYGGWDLHETDHRFSTCPKKHYTYSLRWSEV